MYPIPLKVAAFTNTVLISLTVSAPQTKKLNRSAQSQVADNPSHQMEEKETQTNKQNKKTNKKKKKKKKKKTTKPT